MNTTILTRLNWQNGLRTLCFLCMLCIFTGNTQGQQLVLSQPHGYYNSPFLVKVEWEGDPPTEEYTIRYTLNGAEPTSGSIIYPNYMRIQTNVVLRVAAFNSDGERLTPITSATYLFPSEVMAQDNEPEGYPQEWGRFCQISGTAPADYEMDPEMVNESKIKEKIRAGLTAIPTLSIATNPDYLFSHEVDDERGGIYIYTGTPVGDGTGRDWERPVSMELFGGEQEHDLTVDCGVKIHGGHSRLPEKTPKHSLRLMFKSKFGVDKLKYDLFDADGPKKFNQLVLRSHFGHSWQHWENSDRRKAQYERDAWARTTQQLMGHPASRCLYVHLYLNGLYWGLYNVAERIDDYYCSSHFGGQKTDYDVIKVEEDHAGHRIEPSDGTMDAWNAMFNLAEEAATSNEAYFELIGCNNKGMPTEDVQPLLDVDNFIDFMLINQYGGNTDWDHHNWLAFRNRELGYRGFCFVCWDTEIIFASSSQNNLSLNNAGAPSNLLNILMNNPNFRHRYESRAYKHLVAPGGWLTSERVVSVWDSLYHIIQLPLYDEAARWGDYRRDVHPYTKQGELYTVDNQYQTERQRLLTQYFPNRSQTVVRQMKDRGWYGNTEPPKFYVNGKIDETTDTLRWGDELKLMGSSVIYYTLDGTDPLIWLSDSKVKVMPSARGSRGSNILNYYDWNNGGPLRVRAISKEGTEWSAMIEREFFVDVSTDIADVAAPSSLHNEGIFDLQGRRISVSSEYTGLPKGVYIVNGKKVIINYNK